MIALDAQSIESQQLRLVNQTRVQHAGFHRVLRALQKSVASQRLLLIEAGSIRSKRRVVMAKRQDIISKLSGEIDRMLLGVDEMYNMANDFEQMRYHCARRLTEYVQYTEERIAVQKEKVLLRMTGFAKSVIDDIREEEGLQRNNKSHSILFLLQTCTMKLASDSVLPRLDEAQTLFDFMETEMLNPIVLFNALQLLDMMCSQNWNAGKANAKAEQRQIVHKFLRLIPYTFTFLRTWKESNHHWITIFVSQLFQTLKAVLSILQVLGSVSSGVFMNNPSANTNTNSASSTRPYRDLSMTSSFNAGSTLNFGFSVSTASNDNSSAASEHSTNYYSWTDPSGTYSDEDLATDIILWLKTLKYAKLGYCESVDTVINPPDSELLNTFCKADSFVATRRTGDPYTEDIGSLDSGVGTRATVSIQRYVLQELRVLLALGSPLVTNIIQCAESVAHTLVHIQNNRTSDSSADVAAAASTTTSTSNAASVNYGAKSTKYSAPSQPTPSAVPAPQKKHVISSIPVFGTTAHALLLAGLELGRLSTGKYSARLGAQGSATGIASQHVRFLKAVDAETSAVLHLAMMVFSLGLLERAAFEILQHGYELVVHRCHSYFFVSAWLQCTLVATLLCVERDEIPEKVLVKANQEVVNNYIRVQQTPPADLLNAMTTAKHVYNNNSNSYNISSNQSYKHSSIPMAKPMQFSTNMTPKIPLSTIGKNLTLVSKLNQPALLVPVSTRFISKAELITHLSDGVLRIMAVTAHLRHMLSIVHLGIAIVRLLTRDLFLKRLRIEEIMEISLHTLLIPLLDTQSALALDAGATLMAAKDADAAPPEHSIQDVTLELSASNPVTPEASLFEVPDSPTGAGEGSWPSGLVPGHALDGGSSILSGEASSILSQHGAGAGVGGGGSQQGGSRGNSRGGGKSASSIPTPEVFWKDWVATHLEKEYTGGDGYPAHRMNFLGLLQYIGETHLQSREVIEQLLLLVDHLANKTQVCKFQLVDNGMPLVVQRIVASQNDNIYMIALSELCSDALEVKI